MQEREKMIKVEYAMMQNSITDALNEIPKSNAKTQIESLFRSYDFLLKEAQDKLHRRNVMIKELKKEVKKLKEGNSVVSAILENHPATVFECVYNAFAEHYHGVPQYENHTIELTQVRFELHSLA